MPAPPKGRGKDVGHVLRGVAVILLNPAGSSIIAYGVAVCQGGEGYQTQVSPNLGLKIKARIHSAVRLWSPG